MTEGKAPLKMIIIRYELDQVISSFGARYDRSRRMSI